jgi:leucyl/phenylalanyl-tRNA--protein transferase
MRYLSPDLLIRAYAAGVFPMAERRDDPDVFWIEPRRRGLLPLGSFHVAHSLAKLVRQERFDIRVDTAFDAVMAGCAEANERRQDSWINQSIIDGYTALHRAGCAHSVECWQNGALVGGLYGVSLRGAFFGESMFSRARDASKLALVHLVARLRVGGYSLLDTQFITDHLARFGAIEVNRMTYRRLLDRALAQEGDFARLDLLYPSVGAGSVGAASTAGAADGARVGRGEAASSLDGSASSAALPTSTVSGPRSGKLILQLATQTS